MKRILISFVLFCFCMSALPYSMCLREGYTKSNELGGMTINSIEHTPPITMPYQQRARVQASLASNAVSPLPGACFSAPLPQWEIKVTLTETNGVTSRLTRMNVYFYDDNGVYISTDAVEGSRLSGFFKGCGSDGVTIPANGKLCGDFCVTRGGRKSGAITLGFVIDDGSGQPNGACTSGVVLLGEKSNQGADLSLTNVASTYGSSPTGSVSFVAPGFVFLHKITVTNNGPQTANNVIVTDIMESGATFQAIAVDKGQISVPAVDTNGPVTCTLGSMPPGTSANIWLFVKAVGFMAGFAYNNLASVSSLTSDPNPDNNFAEEAVSLDRFPSISSGRFSIVTTPLTNSAALGTRITYTIKVTNTGPEDASVSLANLVPNGTTFASATADGFIFDKPPVGGTGVILTALLVRVNQSTTITIAVNVLGGTGSTLGDISNNFLFEGANKEKLLSACPGIPLQVASGESQSADVIRPGSIGISGGGIISIIWGVGSPSAGDPTPSPRLGGGAALSLNSSADDSVSLPPTTEAAITPSAEPCTLIRYKLYIADNPASVVDPSNVWKMLPPDVSSTSAPRAPNGSSYALVAVYRCPDGTTRDSQPSNIISTNPGPRITGTPFREGKHLYVPGDGFVDGARIFRNDQPLNRTILETSTLLKAKKEGKNTFSGDRIKVRNPDGSESNTVIYP